MSGDLYQHALDNRMSRHTRHIRKDSKHENGDHKLSYSNPRPNLQTPRAGSKPKELESKTPDFTQLPAQSTDGHWTWHDSAMNQSITKNAVDKPSTISKVLVIFGSSFLIAGTLILFMMPETIAFIILVSGAVMTTVGLLLNNKPTHAY